MKLVKCFAFFLLEFIYTRVKAEWKAKAKKSKTKRQTLIPLSFIVNGPFLVSLQVSLRFILFVSIVILLHPNIIRLILTLKGPFTPSESDRETSFDVCLYFLPWSFSVFPSAFARCDPFFRSRIAKRGALCASVTAPFQNNKDLISYTDYTLIDSEM